MSLRPLDLEFWAWDPLYMILISALSCGNLLSLGKTGNFYFSALDGLKRSGWDDGLLGLPPREMKVLRHFCFGSHSLGRALRPCWQAVRRGVSCSPSAYFMNLEFDLVACLAFGPLPKFEKSASRLTFKFCPSTSPQLCSNFVFRSLLFVASIVCCSRSNPR